MTDRTPSEKEVEAGCRAICAVDGIDPDHTINRDDADYSVRCEPIRQPAWTAWKPEVIAALLAAAKVRGGRPWVR